MLSKCVKWLTRLSEMIHTNFLFMRNNSYLNVKLFTLNVK